MRQARAVLAAAAVLWVAGFAWFSHAARQPGTPPPHVDGIVALTGGAERVETALRLLADNVAPVLLVSGVARRADIQDLVRRGPEGARPLADRVTLGRAATSTLGNALETASWARGHGMHSLAVVTSGYHMPRALLEIGRALPEAALYPVPVFTPAWSGPTDLATLRVLAVEYNKWLAVRFHLARWLRTEDGP